jgi:TolB-like protein
MIATKSPGFISRTPVELMMKKTLVTIFFCFSLILIGGSAWADYEKIKIAVLDFQLQGTGYETEDMGKIVAEWLITALVKEGRFEVIERRLLKKILEEHKLVMTGVVDEDSATQLGKLLGVKVIISGSVMKFQNIMEVNARIIDVKSASIIAAENAKSATAIRLEDLVVQMAEKIIKDFPLEGYIVHRDGTGVVIDLGKRAGVKRGMQFMVFKEGQIIKHPRTGEVLDVEKIETGKVEISSVSEKIANAEIIKETTPNAIAYGQMVKSVVKPSQPVGQYRSSTQEAAALKSDSSTGVLYELSKLDPLIEEAEQMKAAGDPRWEIKIKSAFTQLEPIYEKNPKSPEVFLYYAKAYYVTEKLRRVNKCFKKALYYDPNYIEALELQGDMNFNYGKKIGKQKSLRYKLDVIARNAYESAAQKSQNVKLQAMMYNKIGDVYADLSDKPDKAKEYWQKAVSTAENSEGARLAAEKLRQ